jgi:hypothetical protein
MSRDDDDGERGRGEPIDVEYEPYREERRSGVGFGTVAVLALVAAGVGAAGGAVAPRVPAVQAALNNSFPVQGPDGQPVATTTEGVSSLDQRLDAIEALINTPLSVAASDQAGDAGTAARVFAIQAGLRDVETRLSQMPSSQEVSALITEVRRLQEELPAVAAEARAAATAARASYAVVAASEARSRRSCPTIPTSQRLSRSRVLARQRASSSAISSHVSTTRSFARRVRAKRAQAFGAAFKRRWRSGS